MKKKLLFVCCILAVFLLAGCTVPERAVQLLEQAGLVEEAAQPDYSKVTGELESKPSDFPGWDGYYILHDGLYYPCIMKDWNDDEEFAEEYYMGTDPDGLTPGGHMFALNADYDLQVPTLYLENGDELIYYSRNSILNYYVFVKYWDLGYSIPVVNYQATVAGYPYITVSAKTEGDGYTCHLLPSEMKDTILAMDAFSDEDYSVSMRFLAFNGTPVDESYIEDGILRGLGKNEGYLVSATLGSSNVDFTASAEYHYFKEGEIYAEADYETLYDDTYRINIPDYLTDGYYMTGNGSVFRLVTKGGSFDLYNTDEAQFNTKTLYLDEEYILANGGSTDEKGNVFDCEGNMIYTDYGVYSSNPKLNHYSTTAIGALGYGMPDGTEVESIAETGGEQQVIHPMYTCWYKLVQLEGETSEERGLQYEVISDASGLTPPCVITQYYNGGEESLSCVKNGDSYHYRGMITPKTAMEEPLYLSCECPDGIIPEVAILSDGFILEEVTDTVEIDQAGRKAEAQRRN